MNFVTAQKEAKARVEHFNIHELGNYTKIKHNRLVRQMVSRDA